VTVRRIAKTGPPKAAQTTVRDRQVSDAKLNADIGRCSAWSAHRPSSRRR
jgi:hypothetical protein